MATKIQLLGFQAGLTAARFIVTGARREIDALIRRGYPDYSPSRLAARGTALSGLEELYFTGLTTPARERLRRIAPPAGVTYINGYDALLHLAGWKDVP